TTTPDATVAPDSTAAPENDTTPAPDSTFDVAAAIETLLSYETEEEMSAFLSTLTEEQRDALAAGMTEEDIVTLAEKLGYDSGIETVTPPVNYTEVGPLLPSVNVAAAPAKRMLRAMSATPLAEPEEPEETDNGLQLSKTAVYDADSKKATITMEAYTTGTVTSSTDSVPCDIVLVLDESGSMSDSMYSYQPVYESQLEKDKAYYIQKTGIFGNVYYTKVTWCDDCQNWMSGSHLDKAILFFKHAGFPYVPKQYADDNGKWYKPKSQFYEAAATDVTKKQALAIAANKFVDNVYDDAKSNNVDHRISVIGFNETSNVKVSLNADIRNNVNEVKGAIDGLATAGGTYIEMGLANAVEQFKKASSTSATERKHVVVVFTDGIPGSGDWTYDETTTSANSAIEYAYQLKNTYGATVYTIGMLEDADPELNISQDQGNSDVVRTNRFLHYLSSNYPNARSMTNGGTGSNAGYYLSASDTDSLNAIFEKISEEIQTPSIQLGSSTVIKDIVTPYFEMPADASDIHLYTVDYNGTTFDETTKKPNPAGVTAEITGDTVSVTGFDFNQNFVSNTAKKDGTFGKKLIIEFTVPVKDGFLGGNDVPTNATGSGVYLGDKQVELFKNPTVNIPVAEPEVKTNDVTIYQGNFVDASELYQLPTFTDEEAWKYAFVDISATVTGASAQVEVSPDNCTGYTVTVTYTPTSKGNSNSFAPVSANSNTGTATVHVLKPTVTATVNDVQKYYGESYTLGDGTNGTIRVIWTDSNSTHTGIPNANGEAPYTERDLHLDYSTAAFSDQTGTVGKSDFDVTVKVMKGNDEVPNATITTTCSVGDNPCESHTNGTYKVHVNTCSLTITKNGGAAGEPYVFKVYKGTGENKQLYTEASVTGNTSVTICELPVGTYSIEEDSKWSWRYTPGYMYGNVEGATSVALSKDNPIGTITCTNKKAKVFWLNGYSSVEKNIFGKPDKTIN
ncbi:MAG: VWA domain-containing protein, partial [Oscillospiraceae bacterium]|nr:VWA domain-containing protein [Oscillospiraceae bacterium]